MKQKFGNTSYSGNRVILILTLVVILLILGIALAYLQFYQKNDSGNPLKVHQISNQGVTLYTPETSLEPGDIISSELNELTWLQGEPLPEGYIDDLKEIVGKYAIEKIPAGVPITKNLISNILSEDVIKIQHGMRAVSIEVNSKRTARAWTLPGDRVDVILTYLDKGKLTSKIIVENARIISVGGYIDTVEDRLLANQRQSTPTITLELTPEDALKIETAKGIGNLNLHTRSREDYKSGGIVSVNAGDLSNKNPKEPKCHKGKIKISGKEYWSGCDGQLIKVDYIS